MNEKFNLTNLLKDFHKGSNLQQYKLPLKILSVDAESNGLWGEIISIGFIAFDNGNIIEEFEVAYIDERIEYSDWVKENVLPKIINNPKTIRANSYFEMLKIFAEKYNKYYKEEKFEVLYHMGHIVESNVFKELRNYNLIGEWDAPYTPIEISNILWVLGFKPDSVDNLINNGLITRPEGLGEHSGVYDALVQGVVYFYLLNLLNK